MKYDAQAFFQRKKGTLKPKPRSKADYVWINFGNAVGDIAKALNLSSEIAQPILFGLIATGKIRASDSTDLVDLDECTIAKIEGKAAFVAEGELMNWLRDHSTAPSANIRDAEIRKRLPRRMNFVMRALVVGLASIDRVWDLALSKSNVRSMT
jgi:hypothetical protein